MNELQLAFPLVLILAVFAASNLGILLRSACVCMLVGSSLPVLAVVGRPGLAICTAAAMAFLLVGLLRTFERFR